MGHNTNLVDRIPARQPAESFEIFTVDDFPAPVDGGGFPQIQLLDNVMYYIRNDIDVGPNQLMHGANTWMTGQADGVTKISGTTNGYPLMVTNGNSGMKGWNLSYDQFGSGELIVLDSGTNGNSFKFIDCVFKGGNIRVVDGLVIIMDEMLIDENVQLIFDGTGAGVSAAVFSNVSVIFALPSEGPKVDGIVLFESGCILPQFTFQFSNGVLFNPSTVFKVELGANIGSIILDTVTMDTFFSSEPTILVVQNPDDVGFGTFESVANFGSFGVPGNVFACEPVVSSSQSITVPTGAIYGVAISGTGDGQVSPGGNLIVSRFGPTQSIYLKDGISDTDLIEITTPLTNPRDVTWHRGNLYHADSSGGGHIYKHDGFSTTILGEITPIAGGGTGVVFVGDNLVTCSVADGLVRVFEGFSDNPLTSFASGFAEAGGIAFDGINLIIMDNQSETVNVMLGVSGTIQYSFTADTADGRGVAYIPGDGFLICDLGGSAVDVYDTPVTFDHSSKTWEMISSPGIVASSDRGGVSFADLEGSILDLPVVDNWEDLENQTAVAMEVPIYFGSFAENEKCFMSDETIGEITWTGVRDRGRIVAAQVTFKRNEGAAASDVPYEIAISIDRGLGYIIQGDTVASSVQRNAIDFSSVSTMPVTRDLVAGDRLKIQIRNRGNTDNILVTAAKLAIT